MTGDALCETIMNKHFYLFIIKITISSIVIGFKKLLFSINSLVKLLSDSLSFDSFLSDSSISQSYSKL